MNLAHPIDRSEQRLAFQRCREKLLGARTHGSKNGIGVGAVSGDEDMAMLGDLKDFLDGQNSLFLVRSDVNDNDVCFHRLNLVENPTIERRVKVVEFSSHFNLV